VVAKPDVSMRPRRHHRVDRRSLGILTRVSDVTIDGIGEHRGDWVAVDYARRRVLFGSTSRADVIAEVKRRGLRGAVVLQVPKAGEPLLVGLG
jgi:hypothetical protein